MNVNKEIMDYIMSDGTILWEDHNATPEGTKVDCYIVEENGVKYTMTKHDEEWIYINAEVGGRKKMKVRDLLAMDICVDVADDYDERLWIAFDGAISLTEIGMDVFREALDLEVKLTTPSDALIICKNAKEAETARELFESLAGYCTDDEWKLWFEEV